ncbi:hypothetical protein PF003_g10690 [Phytophthora fragariae]|nr:hypothetical protein PF003_g10690 [Phytophthora fragariae]
MLGVGGDGDGDYVRNAGRDCVHSSPVLSAALVLTAKVSGQRYG